MLTWPLHPPDSECVHWVSFIPSVLLFSFFLVFFFFDFVSIQCVIFDLNQHQVITIYVSTNKKQAYKERSQHQWVWFQFLLIMWHPDKLNKARTECGSSATAVSIQTKEIHFLNHWTTGRTSDAPTLIRHHQNFSKFQMFWLENTFIGQFETFADVL